MWVALGEGGGVARFLPDARLDEIISLPAVFVSSLSFGGSDLRDVLISTPTTTSAPSSVERCSAAGARYLASASDWRGCERRSPRSAPMPDILKEDRGPEGSFAWNASKSTAESQNPLC